MVKYLIFLTLFLYGALSLKAQKDSIRNRTLKEITISDERLNFYNTGHRSDKPDSLLQKILNTGSLATLLDASGGLLIRSYGPGILATSALRGGNAQQTALIWQGISVNSPVNGLTDLNLLPSFLFNNVAVIPGISGSLQGSGAIGGGISLSDNGIQQKGFKLNILQSFGSFGAINTGLKVSYSKNKWSTSTGLFYSRSKNNYPFINSTEAGNPTQKMSNAQCKNLAVLHQTSYRTTRLGIFKLSYWGTFANRHIPPTMLMAGSDATQKDQGNKTLLQWDKQMKKGLVKFKSLWQKDYLLYKDSNLLIHSFSESEMFVNDLELRFKLSPSSNTGFGIVKTNTSAKVSEYQRSASRSQTAFWVNHFQNISVIKTKINLSIRQEIVDSKALPFIPSIGFKTNLHRYLDVFGQVSRVYRIPTLNDLFWYPGGNINLKPESGWAGELNLGFTNKIFNITLCGFSRTIENWIQWQPVTPQIWSPVNIGKVRSRGLELRSLLKLNLGSQLQSKIGLNADYTQSTNLEKEDPDYQKQLLYIPFFKYSGFASLGYRKTVLLIYGSIIGKRYTSPDNKDSLPAYGLINIALSTTLNLKKTETEVFLKINNVTNAGYQAIVWRPMPGINFEAGLNFKI